MAQPQGANALIKHIRSVTPAIVTDNAPRFVAGFKTLGASVMLFDDKPLFKLAGAFNIAGHLTMALSGHKKTEAEKQALRNDSDVHDWTQSDNPWIANMGKVIQPHKYPLESSMALYFIGDSCWTAAGLFNKDGISKSHVMGGALNLASDINGLVTDENTQPKENPHKEGTIPYYISEFQELRHRPVLVSSLLNAAGDLSSIVIGAHEHYKQDKPPHSMIAGSLLFIGNMIQAIYVDKDDYNIEAKEQAAPDTIVSDRAPANTLMHDEPRMTHEFAVSV